MTGKTHVKKTLLELAEYIDESQNKHSIYYIECSLFDIMLRMSADNENCIPMLDSIPIDQQIYFVLLVNEATK